MGRARYEIQARKSKHGIDKRRNKTRHISYLCRCPTIAMEPGNQCYTPVEEQPCTPSAVGPVLLSFFSSPPFPPRKTRRQPYIKGTTPQKATTISLRRIEVNQTAEAEGKFVETASRPDDRELFAQKKEEEKVPPAIYLSVGGEDCESNVPTF